MTCRVTVSLVLLPLYETHALHIAFLSDFKVMHSKFAPDDKKFDFRGHFQNRHRTDYEDGSF